MKTFYYTILLAFLGLQLSFAQVGVGTTTPDPNAALDVESTTQGVLIPRMLKAQRELIGGGSPAAGLLVYQTDQTSGFYYYDGTSWVSLSSITPSGLQAINTAAPVGIPDLPVDGSGLVKVNRTAANYGDVGYEAVDLSFSYTADNTLGATGPGSLATGVETKASGGASTALGNRTVASGQESSTAMGSRTTASGDNATAMGFETTAFGFSSTSMGRSTTAESFAQTTLGLYNVPTPANDTENFDATDRVLVVGNGTDDSNTSDALVILKNGTITAPSLDQTEITDDKALITKEYADANLVSSGLEIITEGDGGSGLGANKGWRLIGLDSSNYGTIGNGAVDLSLSSNPSTTNGALGSVSFAAGLETSAAGIVSTAMGNSTIANAYFSTAVGSYNSNSDDVDSFLVVDNLFQIGNGFSDTNRSNALTVLRNGTITAPSFDISEITDAKALITKEYADANLENSGLQYIDETDDSTDNGGLVRVGRDAANYGNIGISALDLSISNTVSTTLGATGTYSTATGFETTASGNGSTALGAGTKANAVGATAIGSFNIGGGTPDTFIATEPIFEVGNGMDDANRSNALTVLKNGNVGIGVPAPEAKLDIAGDLKITDGTEGVGKLLTSDANGHAKWEAFNTGNLFGAGFVPELDICLETKAIFTTIEIYSVAVSGNYAFVGVGGNTLKVFDMSAPTNTGTPLATIATGSFPRSVAVSDNYAFVVNAGDDNMMVFDISAPTNTTTPLATIATGSLPYSVAVSGNYAFVVNNGDDNMMVFDISAPTNTTTPLATIATGDEPISVTVSGDYAFVLHENSDNMMVFDISAPTNTSTPLATIATGSFPRSVAVSDNYAFVVNAGDDNMMVFDISAPTNTTTPLATIATGNFPYSVAVSGNYAFVVNDGDDNMMVFDISAPTNTTTPLATIATGDEPNSVAVSGDYAAVVGRSSFVDHDMRIFDLYCQNLVTVDPLSGEFISQPMTGEVGPQGPVGPQGSQGLQGIQGVQGISVTNAEVLNDDLVITLSDASSFNVGNVKGDQGEVGPQGPVGPAVNATGTENYLAKFGTSGTILGDSSILEDALGKVGINTNTPNQALDVDGQIRMRTGATTGYVPVSSADGTMTWTDPATFISPTPTGLEAINEGNGIGFARVGRVSANYGNVGLGAVDLSDSGSPSSTKGATGAFSVAMGGGTTASGIVATAIGNNTIASGITSTAMGNFSAATGDNSTAIGDQAIASGQNSNAMGRVITAESYAQTTLGLYNVASAPSSTTGWIASDRLLVVGNGQSPLSKSDALVILKNGNATLSGNLTENSDFRLKKNIQPLENSLVKLLKLEGKNYYWNDLKPHSKDLQIGLIAQELETVFPELVHTGSDGYKSVDYTSLIPVLIEATKSQQEIIEMQNERIKALEEQNRVLLALEARLKALENDKNASHVANASK